MALPLVYPSGNEIFLYPFIDVHRQTTNKEFSPFIHNHHIVAALRFSSDNNLKHISKSQFLNKAFFGGKMRFMSKSDLNKTAMMTSKAGLLKFNGLPLFFLLQKIIIH